MSSLSPYRRPLFPQPKLIEAWFKGKKEKRNMIPVNEKIHWSVMERVGRRAIVDEKIRQTYRPPNLPAEWSPKRWRESERAAAEKHPRVAQKTAEEEKLIDACRNPKVNPRFQKCALFCSLGSEATDQAPRRATLRALFSASQRRARRLTELRKMWGMPDTPR